MKLLCSALSNLIGGNLYHQYLIYHNEGSVSNMGIFDFLKRNSKKNTVVEPTVGSYEDDLVFDVGKFKKNKVDWERQYQINQKGMRYEKAGEIDKAIKQYELAISKNFDGNHPYDRLAILYRKRKHFDDEIRVLEKAIWVFENVVADQRAYKSPKIQKFKDRLEKAKNLKEKEAQLD